MCRINGKLKKNILLMILEQKCAGSSVQRSIPTITFSFKKKGDHFWPHRPIVSISSLPFIIQIYMTNEVEFQWQDLFYLG
jgi:hypothetical protein